MQLIRLPLDWKVPVRKLSKPWWQSSCFLIPFSFWLLHLKNGSQRHLGQWKSSLHTSRISSVYMWRLHTSICMLSIAPSSSPLNYALYMLCAAKHWSFKYRCLVQRLVIRQKDLVKRSLWNYSNALCVWNCSSRIIYLEKGTFKDALSLFWNFCSSPLFTDVSCIFLDICKLLGFFSVLIWNCFVLSCGPVNWWALYPGDQESGASLLTHCELWDIPRSVQKRSCLWDFMLFLFCYSTSHSLDDAIKKDKKNLINSLE